MLDFSNDERMTITADSISVTLTQAETLMLMHDADVRMQIRAKFADGSAVASNIMQTTVSEILKDGEI